MLESPKPAQARMGFRGNIGQGHGRDIGFIEVDRAPQHADAGTSICWYKSWAEAGGDGRPGAHTREDEVLCALQDMEAHLLDLQWKVDILLRMEEHRSRPYKALGLNRSNLDGLFSKQNVGQVHGLQLCKVDSQSRSGSEAGPQLVRPKSCRSKLETCRP